MIILLSDTTSYHTSLVAFSGFKRGSQEYSAGDVITINGTFVDEGASFDPQTSKFTCPVAGIYFVSANMRRNFDPVFVSVIRGTVAVAHIDHTDSDFPLDTVSNAILTRAFPGDQIFLQATGTGALYGDESRAFTTFSVVLMYEY